MIRVNKSTVPSKASILKAFGSILDSGKLTNNGKYVLKLEHELVSCTQAKHACVVANGTLALHMAIKALGRQGEIVTTPFSFIASSSSIIWENCIPVFADIDPETFCIDPKSIKSCITDRTIAIMPVHIFGNICDINAIETIASEHGLATVYDGAHAFGSSYKGRSVFTYGTFSTLSMHAYKVLSSIEGGAIFCNDGELFDSVHRMRYFGMDGSEQTQFHPGTNAKISELNAAFGLESLKGTTSEISNRKANAHFYRTALEEIGAIQLQRIQDEVESNHAYFPIVLESEEEVLKLIARGRDAGVEFRRYFHPSLNTLNFVTDGAGSTFSKQRTETPIADSISKRIVCLPVYGALKEDELNKIVSTIRSIYR